ncbi:uncharacterized protein LOC109852575 [Pseudomyrmex gracilis]|uniref:uncharacterized protein LOC109852575 n=1 Tax=Pseudomyrmex gracilis TaxID=219809 RepID=UPI0009958A8E|nr:uncharacterized protein LOC109852575 [Pseudomyrmex gracilis]
MSGHELRSKAFNRAANNLVNKLNATFLKNYPHHVMPGYNMNKLSVTKQWNEETALEFYQEFPYSCELPKPLLPPARLPRTVLSEEDPILQLLAVKSHLKDDLKRIMNYYEKHKQEFDKIKKRIKWNRGHNGYSAQIPRYIADIAELIDMDPDPSFEGTYNWYYTGGSLSHVCLNGWDVLIFPFMGELVAAHIASMGDFIWKPIMKNSAKCELKNGLKLYETRQSKVNNTCRILGRYKNYCTLYMLSHSEDHLKLDEIHQQAIKIPYISADLSLTDNSHHCTLNIEGILSLWDINRIFPISTGSVPKNIYDPWRCIRYQEMDANILICVDRCCLHYLDTRIAVDSPCLTLCPKGNLENCEILSIEAPSKNGYCRYLGTSHSFLTYDSRSPNQCVRQKWTHQFKDTPLLAAVTTSDYNEIIVLSSQRVGENAIILNTWLDKEVSHSFNLPFVPPSIVETLNASQVQGLCLNPYLKNRFELCNAGSTLVSSTGELFYFVQNSIGDIFYQCITHEDALDKYSPVNNKSCYALDVWAKTLSSQSEPLVPLALTKKCNMQHIYENFTNRKLRLKTDREIADSFELIWKQSLSMLGSYVDLLAPELLAVWEMREELTAPVVTGFNQKVINWLESSTANVPTQSQDDEESSTPVVNTQELISVSQEYNLAYIEDSDMLQDMLLPGIRSGPRQATFSQNR